MAAYPLGSPRILSEEPRVLLHPSFLNASEVAALRALAEEVGLEDVDPAQARTNGGEELLALNFTAVLEDRPDEESISAAWSDGWAAVARLEASAAAWAKLRREDVPAPLLTRWEPWFPTSKLNRSGVLHLDARRNLWRHKTVLVYLSGDGSADDGFTVFPCLETEDMETQEAARRAKLCSRASRHLQLAQDSLLRKRDEGLLLHPHQQYDFLQRYPELAALVPEDADAGGRRPVDWRWLQEHDDVAAGAPGAPRADALYALVEAMCRGQAPGLRVAPVVGTALLLEIAEAPRGRRRRDRRGGGDASAAPAGGATGGVVPDWRLWHAGCSARGGRRWTVQVFLEQPRRPKGATAAPTMVAEAGGRGGSVCEQGQCAASGQAAVSL